MKNKSIFFRKCPSTGRLDTYLAKSPSEHNYLHDRRF